MKKIVEPVIESVAIAPVAGLDPDKTYYVENAGRTPVYVDKMAAAPASPTTEDGVEILPGNSWNRSVTEQDWKSRGHLMVKLPAGMNLYAWAYEYGGVLQVFEVV